MQLRPLEIPHDEHHFVIGFERWFFNRAAKRRSYYEYTQTPTFIAPSLATMLYHFGFDRMPVFNKELQDYYPLSTPYGSHPKCYLKWGIEHSRRNHVTLELGEQHYLIHFDLKTTRRKRWHIDQMIIRDGGNEYFIPCDDMEYKFLGDELIITVRNAISQLNEDTQHHFILTQFKRDIQSVLEKANAIATDYDAHSTSLKMPSERFPFTP